MQANKETLRKFIAAALCDFVGHLDALDSPIVVGGSYSKDLLLKQFEQWCRARNFSVEDPDGAGWINACNAGSLLQTATEGEEHASP